MDQAQGAIDAARAAGAERYAPSEFAAATDALKRSTDAVAQNDYRLALNHAIESRERAQDAAKNAVDRRAKARGDAERMVAEANSIVTQARERFGDAALAKMARRTATDVRQQLATAQKNMQEARAALEQDDYERAIALAKTTGARIQELVMSVEKPLPAGSPRKRR
jgi:hypothetical protein